MKTPRLRNICFVAALIVMLVLSALQLEAQNETPYVRVSNDDPKWGEKITISYEVPNDSLANALHFEDTVYCAALCQCAWSSPNQVQTMKRVPGTYRLECFFTIPDSCYQVRLEVCRPGDRLPNGITIFTVRTRDGAAVPGDILQRTTAIDSALSEERKRYPLNYRLYYDAYSLQLEQVRERNSELTKEERVALVRRYLDSLSKSLQRTTSWYVTSLLLSMSIDTPHEKLLLLAKKLAREGMNDELLHQESFWNMAFYPRMVNGTMHMPDTLGSLLAPLARNFPRSVMAHMWLKRMGDNAMISPADFRFVAAAWDRSNDVDLFASLAASFGNEHSALFDPQRALGCVERALRLCESKAGFFSGENIFGSMRRAARLYERHIICLRQLKRYHEASSLAMKILPNLLRVEDKAGIYSALIRLYLDDNNGQLAERQLAILLNLSSRRSSPDIDRVYALRKQNNESKDDYLKRIRSAVDAADVLPPIKPFRYTTGSGKSGSTADFLGKVVVMDFWFIGCPGCQVERKSLDRLAEHYKSNNSVVFLSAALNDAQSLNNYLKSDNPLWPVIPSAQELCDAIGIQSYPTHVILDQNGKTVCWESGGSEDSGEQLRKRIEEVLGQSK